MDKKNQEYIARVSTATPLQLVVITYDIILEEIDKILLNIKKPNVTNDIIKVQKLLNELITSLNMDIEISKELLEIYMYVNKLLISCLIKSNIKNREREVTNILTAIKAILNNLLISWKSIEDKEEAIITSSQQIFVGLTYQKSGKLNEFIDENISRSFKA